MTTFQIDFQGDDDNLIRGSQDHVTSSVDLGHGDFWNSFLIETDRHAVSNPRLSGLRESDGDASGVSLRIEGGVAAYNTGAGSYTSPSSYTEEHVVSMLGDHIWFAQGRDTSETIRIVFEGLDPGTYDLTSYVNYTAHDPIRTFDKTVNGETIRVDGQKVKSGSNTTVSADENAGTLSDIEVGADGTLIATYRGVPQSDGAMDPSIAGLMLTRVGSDESGGSPANTAPIAHDDSATTAEGQAVRLDVLHNDRDADGDPLAVASVGETGSGRVNLNSDGTVTYVPNAGFSGTDSFSYLVSDGRGGTDAGQAWIRVEDAGDEPSAPTDPDALFTLSESVAISGARDVVNVDGSGFLQLSEGTISLSFNADTTSGTRGIFSRDAEYFSGDGNHFSAYIENGTLKGRVQAGGEQVVLSTNGISANRDYHLAYRFDESFVEMYVNGRLVDRSESVSMDWANSNEFVQIGALGWASAPGDDSFDSVFDGNISDLSVYGAALDQAAIAELAAGEVPDIEMPEPEPEPSPEPEPGPEPDPGDALFSFDGTRSFDGTPTNVERMVLDGDFTISAVVDFAAATSIDYNDAIVGHGNLGSGNDLNFYEGKFRLFTSLEGRGQDVVIASTKAEAGDRFEYTVSREAGVTKLYVNGVLEDVSDTKWNDEFVITEIGGGVRSGGLQGSISNLEVRDHALEDAPSGPHEEGGPLLSMVEEASYDNGGRDVSDIVLSEDFTVSAFVFFDHGTGVDNRDAIVGRGDVRDGNDLNFYDGKFRLYSSENGAARDVVIADTAASGGDAHHYAVTREDGVTRLYVNGELEDVSDQTWVDDFVVSEVGSGVQPGGLDGSISNLQVLDYAADANEISGFADEFLF